MNKSFTAAEISRFDLKQVCYHEAGHLAALFALGGVGRIVIHERKTTAYGSKLFTGRCVLMFEPTAERGRILVGLAGVVADELLHDMQIDARWMYERFKAGAIPMSGSDAKLSEGFILADVEQVTRLLREQWEEVQRFAEWEFSAMEGVI